MIFKRNLPDKKVSLFSGYIGLRNSSTGRMFFGNTQSARLVNKIFLGQSPLQGRARPRLLGASSRGSQGVENSTVRPSRPIRRTGAVRLPEHKNTNPYDPKKNRIGYSSQDPCKKPPEPAKAIASPTFFDSLESNKLIDKSRTTPTKNFHKYRDQTEDENQNKISLSQTEIDEIYKNTNKELVTGVLKADEQSSTEVLKSEQTHIMLGYRFKQGILIWGKLTSRKKGGDTHFIDSFQPLRDDKSQYLEVLPQGQIVKEDQLKRIPENPKVFEDYVQQRTSKFEDIFLSEFKEQLKLPIPEYDGKGYSRKSLESAYHNQSLALEEEAKKRYKTYLITKKDPCKGPDAAENYRAKVNKDKLISSYFEKLIAEDGTGKKK